MGTFSLFRVADGRCERLSHDAFKLERELQQLVEHHMEGLLGAKFIKSEHVIANGRIDTLGLDENNSPVIIEYKRGVNESVLSQALFYLDWLVNHKADFTLLVQRSLGSSYADVIDWSKPRLICIAEGYTPYDRYAVNQINREIQLLQYSRLPNDLLLLELLNDAANPFGKGDVPVLVDTDATNLVEDETNITIALTHYDDIKASDSQIQELFHALDSYILTMGEAERRPLKVYIAYRKVRNFACIVVQKKLIYLYLKLDPNSVTLEKGFTRDVRRINHFGTGDLEVIVKSREDAERAIPMIDRAYSENL